MVAIQALKWTTFNVRSEASCNYSFSTLEVIFRPSTGSCRRRKKDPLILGYAASLGHPTALLA